MFKKAKPYQNDAMKLPVKDLEQAIPFYETVMGFTLVSRTDAPCRSAVLARDEVQIGLAENGGDPTQDGCFFLVDDVEKTFANLKARGLNAESPNYRVDRYGGNSFKVFFVVAPDGLCYCLGEQLNP
jgi:catechol 2,3-dioxygenase-like lactoylglutathione lyase family enzyme